MVQTFFTFLLILFYNISFSQSLLLNGGMEEVNICTEYDAECSPEAWISSSPGFSNYFNDANRAHTGLKCMAIDAGHSLKPYFRSFIRSSLLCGLQKGKKYRLEFFVKSPHPRLLDSLGFYFASIDPLMERKPVHLLAPSDFLAATQSFRNDSNWQKVDLEYTATGAEAFFTLAYFGINDVQGTTGLERMNTFQIFVDDFNLHPLDPAEVVCNGWEMRKEEIYDEDARHQWLQRTLAHKKRQQSGPLNLPLMRTIKVDTIILPDILFETGKATLSSQYLILLDSFCRMQNGRMIDSLIVIGHTDSTGADTLNQRLSEERAGAVASYLRGCSYLGRAIFKVRGNGSRQPLASNNTPENRQKNRRVELVVYFPEEFGN